ncbi:MAG: D-alanyl-D-alanine carboxypeptidase/D-alanyl-D-alanine-endopeptidase [Bacteroidales bacterium]|nr:D-alanyl-D-alanine carboxypeptidase/D-alanyl-D-alanine-endopeptidase [Bacteroidales bacterium]
MTNKLLALAASALLLVPSFGLNAQTKNTAAQKYAEKIDSEAPFENAVWGMLAVKMNGDTLVNIHSQRKMIPASNTKLLSTGLALHNLGSDFRFETKIGYKGNIENGVLNGDVYILGGGDPTIASSDSIAVKINDLFAQWKGFLQKAGITKINGHIIGDGRFFEGPIENDCWQIGDGGWDYGVGGNGLCFFENVQQFTAKPGQRIGDDVKITPKYPETPWMTYYNTATTSAAGNGDDLYYFTTDLAPVGAMRGTLGLESGTRTEDCSNKYGAMTCAYYFYNFLKKNGVAVSEGPADIDDYGNIRVDIATMEIYKQAAEVRDITVIGSTYSPTIDKIAYETNHRSDNFYAETFLRMLGKKYRGSADYESSIAAEAQLLKELGVKNPDLGIQVSDGSGLSRQNYISPDYFVRYLTAMTKSPEYNSFLKSLPQPGQNGTLKSRMQNADPKVKARVYFKTGSMNGVRCYSGYVISESGKPEDTIVFSLLTNNLVEKNVYPMMDTLITNLAKEN